MCGRSDDGNVAIGRVLPGSNTCRGLNAVNLEYLDVHEHEVERLLLQGRQRVYPITDCDRVSALRQRMDHQLLVRDILLGQLVIVWSSGELESAWCCRPKRAVK